MTTTDLSQIFDQWSQAADAVVAKSRRITPSELTEPAALSLASPTADHLTINPLYTRRDELAETGVPGKFPFIRGADSHRDVHMGWRVTEYFGDTAGGRAGLATADVNALILSALDNGASGLWLHIDTEITAGNLEEVLRGVFLDLIPVTLAGPGAHNAAPVLLELIAAAHNSTTAAPRSLATKSSIGLSPLTDGSAIDEAVALANLAGDEVRVFRVDGTYFSQAGASNSDELALVISAGLSYVKALIDSGMPAATALGHIGFAISVDDEQFQSIAKLRALRQLWSRIAEVLGEPDAGGAVTHAITALEMYSQRDPWVNMLRGTVAAFAAGVGGADQCTVLPFDSAVPVAGHTTPETFSRRIARNTQLLLLEEANLGRVFDPAGGSWFVESLTAAQANAAWGRFQEIERRGGFSAAVTQGYVAEIIAESLSKRETELAHRNIAVTGINEFPNLAEDPLPAGVADTVDIPTATTGLVRIAQSYEQFRDRSDDILRGTGARPEIFLCALGSVAEHNGRTTFAANLLAAGGISAINPGETVIEDISKALKVAGNPSVAIICGSDKRYSADGASTLTALYAAGVEKVYVAGAARNWEGQPPNGFIGLGVDAVAMLTELHTTLSGAAHKTNIGPDNNGSDSNGSDNNGIGQ